MPWYGRRPASELAGLLSVGVFGLAASYPLLFEDLMSKLMGLLIVGVFGLAASYPFLLGRLTSKLADVLVVGVAGFEPTTSSSRTKRATKLRHTPCAAGDSIASPHRGEEIGSAESSVTSVFAPCGNPVGPGRPSCQAAHGRSTCWPALRSVLSGPDPVARGPLSPEKVLGLSSLRSPSKHPPQTRSSHAH